MSFTFGCDLKWDSTGGTTFVSVGSLKDIDAPKFKANSIKTTNVNQANQWDTFAPGFRDGSQVSFKIVFDKSATALLMAAFESNTLPNWKLTANDTNTPSNLVFRGFIEEFQPFTVPEDGELIGTVTIKVSGRPTFTQGS